MLDRRTGNRNAARAGTLNAIAQAHTHKRMFPARAGTHGAIQIPDRTAGIIPRDTGRNATGPVDHQGKGTIRPDRDGFLIEQFEQAARLEGADMDADRPHGETPGMNGWMHHATPPAQLEGHDRQFHAGPLTTAPRWTRTLTCSQ